MREQPRDCVLEVDLSVAVLRAKHERLPIVGQVQIVAGDDVLVRVHLSAVCELDLEHPHEPAQECVGERVPIRVLTLDHLPGDECGAIHARTLSARVCQDNAASRRSAHSSATSPAQWYQTD